MNDRETARAIDDCAAAWVSRIDREGEDAAVRAELDAWLAGDERRRGAYFRAEAAWLMLDRASVLGAGQPPALDDLPAVPVISLPRRRLVFSAAGAVAVLLFAGVAGKNMLDAPDERIRTAVGEIRRVPLSDGSFAAVNTQTAIAITMKSRVREISLEQGEAWFQVAKDHDRPFVVEAGDVRVMAVGTAFAVRRIAEGVDVQVTEGVVEIWRNDDETAAQRVPAGARVVITPGKAVVPALTTNEEMDKALAWRTGQLVFDGETVAEAASEFNRYNVRKIEVADAALGSQAMIGRFRTNEPDAFARAVATLLDASVILRADRIILSQTE